MRMEQIDATMGQAVSEGKATSKCHAASVAYTVVNGLAGAAGRFSLKGVALRWVAGKISEYQRLQCSALPVDWLL